MAYLEDRGITPELDRLAAQLAARYEGVEVADLEWEEWPVDGSKYQDGNREYWWKIARHVQADRATQEQTVNREVKALSDDLRKTVRKTVDQAQELETLRHGIADVDDPSGYFRPQFPGINSTTRKDILEYLDPIIERAKEIDTDAFGLFRWSESLAVGMPYRLTLGQEGPSLAVDPCAEDQLKDLGEKILAVVDPADFAAAIIGLGANGDWDSATIETLAGPLLAATGKVGLPSWGDEGSLEFYGRLAIANDLPTTYEPEHDSSLSGDLADAEPATGGPEL